MRLSWRVLLLRTFVAMAGCYATAVSGAGADAAAEPAAAVGLEEIVVTATRREESISRVPISITAISQDAIDQKGIKDFSDIARFTPGVAFDTSQTNQISIRGISSSGGSGTTGIYIDDTPIQVRSLGFNSDDTLVKLFDLDRVEVLRGPQGTLFGAGSEGGTVRYITVQPSLTQTSIYAKAETSYTEGGTPSYESGVAAGRSGHRRRVRRARQRLVPARRRLDRPHRSDHAWQWWTKTRTRTVRRCCESPDSGNPTMRSA